jgi:hypothetical protein
MFERKWFLRAQLWMEFRYGQSSIKIFDVVFGVERILVIAKAEVVEKAREFHRA